MHPHPLFKLRAANKGRGSFKAEGNTIEIYDVIAGSDAEAEWLGGVSPSAFRAALAGMTGPVALRINSPGGDVFGACAMQQAMSEYPDPITAHVDGLAASAASLLVASADRAIMAPGAMLMIHCAWPMCVGDASDMLEMASVLERVDVGIAATYARKTGKDAASYAALMEAETWLTADEAVAEGLADEVAQARARPAAAWDLAAYANAPAPVAVIETEAEAPAAPADNSDRRRRLLAARLVTA
jgi:ATP-dependent Clp protease protease subunit